MGTDQNNDQLRIRRLEQKVRDLEAALAGSFATLNGLQAQEEMFRLLVTHMPDVAWTSDDRGRTIYISPRVEEVYGYSPEEVLAKGEELWFGRVHDDDRERIRSAYEAMFASGAAFDIEYRIRHRQGHWIWLHDRAFARFSKEGRRYAHGVFRDITEQKRLQAARDEADRLLRGMIDAAPFGAHLYELQDGRLVFIGANRAADRILGVDHRQFYGKFIEDAFPPLKDTDIPAAYRATAEHGTPFEQNQVNYENGQIRGAFEVVTAQLGQGRMAAFFRDITERKRGEEALREEKNRSDAILAAIGDGISIQDRDYRVLYQNEVHKDIIGSHIGDLYYAAYESRDTVCEGCPVALAFRDGKVHLLERSVVINGERRFFEISASPLRDAAGEIVAGIEAVREVTSRRRVEEALWVKDAALASSINAIALADLSGKITYANQALLDLWGYTAEEVLRMSAVDFWDTPVAAAGIIAAVLEEDGWRGELTARRKDGTTFAVELAASLVRDQAGTPICMMGSFVDISRRRTAEEDLRRSWEQTRLLIDRMPVACIMWDPQLRVTLWNPAAERIFGYPASEALGMRSGTLIATDAVLHQVEEVWRRVLAGDETAHTMNENRTRDGRTVVCEWFNTPLRDQEGGITGVLSMVIDVTRQREAEEERGRLQAQLLQSQKMEAVGLLAGGVAHDFNNILSAILGYASIVQMKMRPDDPLRSHVEQVLAASQRAASLTQSLLAFSRKQIINPRPVDVNETLRRIEKLLRRIIGEDIEFITHYRAADLTVLADTTQLEQVIINLATNARDAMLRGGRLTVETDAVTVGEDLRKVHGEGRIGTYGLITVSDTGTGMDEGTRTRIFEPFFTTKETGKGTGLGLSTVYGIVKQSGGFVTCDSAPGAGSTFRVYLPLVPGAAAPGPPAILAPPERGSETVLVAEDDPATRLLIEALLTDHGYTVITAEDGEAALAHMRERAGDIGLLLLDVIMPKRNGREVLEEARRLRPGVRALFMSGYTADVIQAKTLLSEQVQLITKPFMPDELLRRVREALERS